MIEILSPNQSATNLITKIQIRLQSGWKLGWLIDPQEQAIMCFFPNNQWKLSQRNEKLPVLDEISLVITPDEIFSWLQR